MQKKIFININIFDFIRKHALISPARNLRLAPCLPAGRSTSLVKKICFSECLGRLKSLVSEGVFSLRAKLLIFRWKKSKSGSEKHIFLVSYPLGLRMIFLIKSKIFIYQIIKYYRNSFVNNRGQILTELIVAISITAIIVAIGAQMIGVSLYSAGSSGDRQTASRLSEEVFEALRAITQGNDAASQGWNRLYLPPDGNGNASTSKGVANPYKLTIVSNAWKVATGTEEIILDGNSYSRYFIIENVSRASSTGAIEDVYNPSNDDPHTQKVIVDVSKISGIAQGQTDFVFSQYFTRYLNEATAQNNWTLSGQCGSVSATSTSIGNCSNTGGDISNSSCGGGVSACLKISQ
ncbi:hypothetical protein HZC33_01405 [Candidatus Wolfebacteria bacterium]|nr:hypothetical protein [Candidatus Wolfebacteria bacterium]